MLTKLSYSSCLSDQKNNLIYKSEPSLRDRGQHESQGGFQSWESRRSILVAFLFCDGVRSVICSDWVDVFKVLPQRVLVSVEIYFVRSFQLKQRMFIVNYFSSLIYLWALILTIFTKWTSFLPHWTTNLFSPQRSVVEKNNE